MRIFILLSMIFCHTIADYNLQGWLANAKQKSWWEENAPESKYKYDYLMALLMHSMCWSFMINLPIAVYYKFEVNIILLISYIMNTCAHFIIDNLKANDKIINLVQDQVMHLLQIFISYIVLIVCHF